MNQYSTSPDTITIELTQGYVTVIDAVDADLAALKWCVQKRRNSELKYAVRRNGNGIRIMHRVILSRVVGYELTQYEVVDHIDGDGLNNRRENLRVATKAQNTRNRKIHTNNTSGFKGVVKHGKRWRAQIWTQGKNIILGSYDTPKEAHAAYCKASKKYHGEFGRTE